MRKPQVRKPNTVENIMALKGMLEAEGFVVVAMPPKPHLHPIHPNHGTVVMRHEGKSLQCSLTPRGAALAHINQATSRVTLLIETLLHVPVPLLEKVRARG